MKKTLIISLLIIGFCSCNNKKYTIISTISGLGNDTVYVVYYPLSSELDGSRNERTTYDMIIAHNDRFHYDLQAHETVVVSIYPKKIQVLRPDPINRNPPLSDYISYLTSRQIFLLLEPGKPLSITGQIEQIGTLDYLSYKVKQPSFSSDYASDRENYKMLEMKRDSINVKIEYNSSDNSLFAARQQFSVKKINTDK